MEFKLKAEKNYCKYLRAKSPYGTSEGGENPWRFADDPNTISWCVKSIGPLGPDNGSIQPKRCVKGRSCYTCPD